MGEAPATDDPFESVLAEFLRRAGAGERVDRENFVAAHPAVAEKLRAFFANADALQAINSPRVTDLAARPLAAFNENRPALGKLMQTAPLDPAADVATGDWQGSSRDTSQGAAVPAGPQPPPAQRSLFKESAVPDERPTHVGRYRVEAILGSGAFGRVYQCQDGVLKRSVAVKVPHAGLLNTPELYLAEARVLAGLEHSAIVPVYDAGQTDEGMCYVVSKYIEGSDLKSRSQMEPLCRRVAVELVATIAEALHYAHVHGVVHRDLKPANILIDLQLRPYLADFGLALKDEDFGQHGKSAGTPAYMSPEQARSEGHLVDGRSDIFSLGVVLYELLTATRPFRGTNIEEVLERIRSLEPRPPRQIDDTIPKELERICLKALAKRASDRYTTARDMADDLRAFLTEFQESVRSQGFSSRAEIDSRSGQSAGPQGHDAAKAQAISAAANDSQMYVKIVPKGLRSFDSSDADFFLKLLPGPHDRYGLPESIRFWKTRIEETDPENSFRAGIIYGPSGCGKSSLVKAGLLPRLDRSIIKVYVEASGAETEDRLLRNLRRHLPEMNEQGGLVKVLAALRHGQGLAAGDKVLLVIDQFEQWLHAHGGEEDAELVLALRQCDGVHVQCLVMVRDDFWLAVSRFMQALEVRVVEGENSRLVDLFDIRHARRVLAALGVAFGALPPLEGNRGERSKEQESFLDQAVAGLAQGGKVVSVRLALFAEMVKSQPWTPSALRDIGGAEGVGVAFLEETFSSPTAPPHHRMHQKAAQSILASLLPEAGTDIKGHMRSREELLEASGCRNRPRNFEEVIALLDNELRLVTPADAESLEADEETAAPSAKVAGTVPGPSAARDKNYQLTHDYLVPALRTWLTGKQKATRRGRAERRLADFASLWTAKPEGRHLPSLYEFLQIRLLAPSRAWTETQRKMMAAAARHHALRGLALMVAVMLIVLGAYQYRGRLKANELLTQLLIAKIDEVPAIIGDMANYRQWVDPLLRRDDDEAKRNGDDGRRLRACLALLPSDEGQMDYLYNRLISAAPSEIDVIRRALLPHKEQLTEKLWGVVKSPRNDQQYLCAVSSLALYAADDPRWAAAAPDVAATLARASPFVVKYWTDALRDVQDKFVGALSGIARNTARNANERLWATDILAACGPDRADLLTPVLIDGSDEQFAVVFPLLAKLGPEPTRLLEAELDRASGNDPADPQSEPTAQRKARSSVALLRLGQPDKVWRLFRKAPDDRVRSYLIHWSRPVGVDPQLVVQRWAVEPDAGARAALLLLLGEFPDSAWHDGQREQFVGQVLAIFETEPDPGHHAAAQWLLRTWKCDNGLTAAIQRLGKNEPQRRADRDNERRPWYVNRQGQTFVVVDAELPFRMGSPESELGREVIERQHLQKIGRSYAIAATPVTLEQFRRFQAERPDVLRMAVKSLARSVDSPQPGMIWYEAAEYCNWLSEKEGISPDQWCYEPNEQGKFAAGMSAKDNYLALTGYRLPTEAEWEFACRAGTTTRFYFGQNDALLANYAWFQDNSNGGIRPVARLKPNDLGLFDMLGNVWQWCECPSLDYPEPGRAVADDGGTSMKVTNAMRAGLRGGAYDNLPRHVRAAFRARQNPDSRQPSFGFRPARTISIQSR